MTRYRPTLQFIIVVPSLLLLSIAGVALYFMVLKAVGNYAEDSIRNTLDALLRSAVTIADSEVDRQNRESRISDENAALSFQLNTRIRFEDFARDQDVGVVVLADGRVDFDTGLPDGAAATAAMRSAAGAEEIELDTGERLYIASARFTPWKWTILVAKNANDFESLIRRVRWIYVGSALVLLAFACLLVFGLRHLLVRPIYQIADEFGAGRQPTYRGIAELEHLSDRIGAMLNTLSGKTQQLQTILESMSDAIAVYDADMRLVAWNPQYTKLYRYPDMLLREGRSFADIMRYNVDRGDYGPVDPDEQLQHIISRARNLDPPRFEIDRADGTSVEVRRAPMPDGGFVTTYTDITYRKQTARLEAANEAKSRFLENMSHDLRKPIAAVIEDCRLFLSNRNGDHRETDRAAIQNANENAVHLLGMVDELLEMSRIEADQIRVNVKALDLDLTINQALRVTEPPAKAKGLSLMAEVGIDQPLKTDGRLLSRILINLLSNAVENTGSGMIAIKAKRDGEVVEIRVSDTGRGIPPDKLSTIFEKFQRIDSTAGITRPGIGLGLGLAISREFAHLLGGNLRVESKLGVGSCFILTIPLHHSEATS